MFNAWALSFLLPPAAAPSIAQRFNRRAVLCPLGSLVPWFPRPGRSPRRRTLLLTIGRIDPVAGRHLSHSPMAPRFDRLRLSFWFLCCRRRPSLGHRRRPSLRPQRRAVIQPPCGVSFSRLLFLRGRRPSRSPNVARWFNRRATFPRSVSSAFVNAFAPTSSFCLFRRLYHSPWT